MPLFFTHIVPGSGYLIGFQYTLGRQGGGSRLLGLLLVPFRAVSHDVDFWINRSIGFEPAIGQPDSFNLSQQIHKAGGRVQQTCSQAGSCTLEGGSPCADTGSTPLDQGNKDEEGTGTWWWTCRFGDCP